ncbi:MAG: hypothetical protein UV40_C0038G0011 [Parcubacteria group bacterium GW2011_GWA1_42_7]|nr:MAG: hypothetical protein UV40_C0038G0011 [Parcubacteria group bacterium GW2011_GWA1_42_7]
MIQTTFCEVVLECLYNWYVFYVGKEDAHGFFIRKIDRKKLWNKPGELIFEVNPKK